MMIGPDIVFVSTPKAGTTTMYQYLRKHWQAERYGAFHETRVPADVRDRPVVTTCRDPYTRAVSMWWHTCHRGKRGGLAQYDNMELATFLRLLPALQLKWCIEQVEWHDRFRPTHVLRLEHLQEDFDALPFVLFGAPPIVPRNRSEYLGDTHDIDYESWTDVLPPPLAKRPRRDYMTDEAAALVREHFAEDFERYGYDTDREIEYGQTAVC